MKNVLTDIFKEETPEERLRKEQELDSQREEYNRRFCIKVKLEFSSPDQYSMRYLNIIREDGVKHFGSIKPGFFFCLRLSWLRKKILKEINLLTDREPIIVLNFETENKN
jgi:hypothetical protein